MLYRHESPLSLRLGKAQQRHNPKQPRQGINEYEPKRENLLEFNNFCMVNVMELVSKSQKSQESQRFQGIKFIVQVHC
jgi:hypothetical protein